MEKDQLYGLIAEFGNDPAAILIYGGPLGLFFVFLMLVVFVSKKKRQDIEKIGKAIESTPAEKDDFPDPVDEPSEALSPEQVDPPSAALTEKTKTPEKVSKTALVEPASVATKPEKHQILESEQAQKSPVTEIIEPVQAPSTEASAKTTPPPDTARPLGASSKPDDVIEIRDLGSEKWLAKLKLGLSKSKAQFSEGLSKILTGKATLDDDLLEEIHETLYNADIGVKTADDLVDYVRKELSTSEAHDANAVKSTLKKRMIEILSKPDAFLNEPKNGPKVVLIVGVNGVGKTTSIGKLAAHYLAQDKSVLLCAADTFRAAAIDQLKVWADRLEVDIVAHKQGADPASVAYDGVKAALSRNTDVLLIDTAGRLHNKSELMDELSKIKRVIKKDLPEAPHETWIVVDATTGQNASQQVKAFREVVDLTGIIVTKLDGTAKGGVVVGISHLHGLPIRYIGVGEKAADLRSFKPQDFVDHLV